MELEILAAFGRHVVNLRRTQGLSQGQLAAKAGLHRTYIGGVERGERNISIINIYRIAAALNVDAAAIIPAIRR